MPFNRRNIRRIIPGGPEIRDTTIDGEKLSFAFPLADGTLLSGEGASDEERMDDLEFIARVTSHIPDNRQVMVRYSKKESLIPSLIA